MRARSIYRDGPLRAELTRFFGERRSLGDPGLRTLLLLVMHNTATDSPWMLSNCTTAKYNRADRCLLLESDRNLDLDLVQLVRASSAAPFYFLPEEIGVGEHSFRFQDGGTTPFNNPAFLLFLMATLPEYQLSWPVGEESLLLVSVGTGTSEAAHPRRTRGRTGVWSLASVPAVFMNGASVTQDMQARAFGRCVAGPQIDREFGARIDSTGVAGTSLFRYARYDADLSEDALFAAGVRSKRRQRKVRKLDAVGELTTLRQLGQRAAADVDVRSHFDGFFAS